MGVSHVFMNLCRHAFQVQGHVTTWSWTCRFATWIIVSPLTGRNRSEVWLLQKCKQFCSQKSFLVLISLFFPTPHIQLFCHILQQRQPSCFVNCRKFSRAAWKAEHEHSPVLRALLFFAVCSSDLIILMPITTLFPVKRQKEKNSTRPTLGIVWVNWFM